MQESSYTDSDSDTDSESSDGTLDSDSGGLLEFDGEQISQNDIISSNNDVPLELLEDRHQVMKMIKQNLHVCDVVKEMVAAEIRSCSAGELTGKCAHTVLCLFAHLKLHLARGHAIFSPPGRGVRDAIVMMGGTQTLDMPSTKGDMRAVPTRNDQCHITLLRWAKQPAWHVLK